MNRPLILLGVLCLMEGAFAQVNISAMEYFLDVDPGHGNGTSIAITPGVIQDVNFSVATGSLSAGFHTLNIRTEDANGVWSHPESRSFFISASTTEIRTDIAAVEYFLDVDPGQGNGVSVMVTPGTDLDLMEQIPTTSLSSGFHTVYFRVQDAAGQWSATEHRPFFISSSTTEVRTNITAVEYFLDVDPGQGNGVSVAITPGTDLDLMEQIPTTSLSSGFHTVYFRVQDAAGQWSATERRPFFISQSTTEIRTNITAVEYFLNVDPGQGNGVSVAITPGTDLDLIEQIPTASLSSGFHTVYFRVQDAAGQWSATEHRPFFISESTTEVRTNITTVEYFLDVDPGHGNGVSVAITPGTDLDLIEQIPTASLSSGFHTVYFRVQDAAGQWSATEHRPFFISESTTEVRTDITAVEYFLDVDPGHGNGVSVATTPNTDLDLVEQIPTSSLSSGFHTVYFRVQDAAGQWSATEHRPFFISKSSTTVTSNLSQLEYYFDVDPGFGNGTPISFPTSNSVDVGESISVVSLPAGFHSVTVRAQSENGVWGQMETAPFYIDERRKINLIEYAFDIDPGTGNGTTVTINPELDSIDQVLSIPSAGLTLGDHDLLVRVKDNIDSWSLTDTVTVNICEGAIADFTISSSNCIGLAVDFTDVSSSSEAGDVYSWDFDGDGFEDDNTVGDASFTYSVSGTYTVTLTIDRLGCTSSQTKTVTVNDLPTVVANTSATTICIGEQVTLFGGGATSYVWDNGVVNNIPFSPTSTSTYTVVGTDSNGCEASDFVTVTVDFPEIDVFEGSDNTGVAIVNNQMNVIDFGTTVEGNDIARTFAIENTGGCVLGVSDMTASSSAYLVTSTMDIAAGLIETFTVTLSSATVGTFDANITITNDDPDESSFTFMVTGEVIAANQPPELSYIFFLDENSEVGKLIGTVVATDPENDPLTYSILSGNVGGAFAIGSISGDITVASQVALDFETTPVFDLVVEANDGKGGVSLVSISIQLRDIVDENPLGTDFSESGFEVYPNPAHKSLFIARDGQLLDNVKIQLLTISGKELMTPKQLLREEGVIELNVEALNSGVYLLRILNGEEVFSKTILVQ